MAVGTHSARRAECPYSGSCMPACPARPPTGARPVCESLPKVQTKHKQSLTVHRCVTRHSHTPKCQDKVKDEDKECYHMGPGMRYPYRTDRRCIVTRERETTRDHGPAGGNGEGDIPVCLSSICGAGGTRTTQAAPVAASAENRCRHARPRPEIGRATSRRSRCISTSRSVGVVFDPSEIHAGSRRAHALRAPGTCTSAATAIDSIEISSVPRRTRKYLRRPRLEVGSLS
jgi:hypothetical protein